MNLFAKGKGGATPTAKGPAFNPIDRIGLLGLLDQVVNGSQSGVLELREPRGTWTYAFQTGALTHASGGVVRGARQAFDLLWEFQAGEFLFTPGQNHGLAGNLYIDKGRLLDLLRRSQAVLQGPSAPYIPPDQQRPIAPVQRPYSPPSPAQMPPAWQPGQQAPGWPSPPQPPMMPGQPVMPPPQWANGYPQPYPPQAPAYPGAPLQGYPAPPGQPYGAPGYPQGQVPGGQPSPAQAYPPVRGNVRPGVVGPPAVPGYPAAPMAPPAPAQQVPFAVPPPPMPVPPARAATPPSFSVPPMPIPKKAQAMPVYQPPAASQPIAPPAEPPKTAPKDDLASLRASLVAQAPTVKPAPSANWGVRTADGTVTPAPSTGDTKGKAKVKDGKKKGDSKLKAAVKVQLIKFLLWACERRYSPEDHWTLKDAFEVSTMELRDQFFGAFSQTFTATKKTSVDDDMDDMAAGRMRGRGRRH